MVKLFSKNSNLCDHNPPTSHTDRQTDGQTDRQTTCDRNTALCTKVQSAVKKIKIVGHYANTTVEHYIYGNVFVQTGRKLEKRQFRAKMHHIASICVSNFKIFPGVIPQDPHIWGGEHPLLDTSPAGRFAPRLVAFGNSMVPPDSLILPLKQTAG